MSRASRRAAKDKGWDVNVIDTKGDVAAVISRIEDVVNQKVDAIVINVDPAQVEAGLQAAKDANIPVFGMDAGGDPLLVTNVTSNGYAMAAETAVYVANRIGGAGNVVMFVFDAFPPVQVRGHHRRRGVRQLSRHQGPRPGDAGRRRRRHRRFARQDGSDPRRQPGSRAASRRCGRPGISPRSARCRRSRRPAATGEGIVITGIDANPQARDGDRQGRQFRGIGGAGFPGRSARPPPMPSSACWPARRSSRASSTCRPSSSRPPMSVK